MRRGRGSDGSRRDWGTTSWSERPDVVDAVGVFESFRGMMEIRSRTVRGSWSWHVECAEELSC